MQWDSHHDIGTVGIYVSTSENPTNWSDFSTTMAKNWFTVRIVEVAAHDP